MATIDPVVMLLELHKAHVTFIVCIAKLHFCVKGIVQVVMLLSKKLYGPQLRPMGFHSSGCFFVCSNIMFSDIMKIVVPKCFFIH